MKKGIFILVILLLTACGDGKSGMGLKVTASTPPATGTVGDGTSDGYIDRFFTPGVYTVAFKSFKMLQQSNNQDQILQSHTLFDVGFEAPKVLELTPGEVIDVEESNSEPPEGTYNRVEFELSYIETIVPVCNAVDECTNRRLRVYLTDMTDPALGNFGAVSREILLSQTPEGFDFAWIPRGQGLSSSSLIPISTLRPAAPYQVISSLFPTGSDNRADRPAVYSKLLPTAIIVPRRPEAKYIFTLDFNLTDLFFFDNTDEAGTDAGPSFHFNALDEPSQSLDGKVLRACSDPPPASDCIISADFGPRFSPVTVSFIEEKEEN